MPALRVAFAGPLVLPEAPVDPLPEDCPALSLLAETDIDAATVLPVLCPDAPLSAVTARAVLLTAGSMDAARRRTALLAPFPELAALAQLVAHVDVEMDVVVDAVLPNPASAVVTPLDSRVLATAQLARAQLREGGLGPTAHTRARAYLAKVFAHALRQLGVGPAHPPGPLGRLLAAQAIHYGRTFCDAYWRRRVSGLYPLVVEVELSMLGAVLALESDSTAGDLPLTVLELQRGRAYLLRSETRARLDKQLESDSSPLSPNRLGSVASELPRLIEHGFVDLAIGRALSMRKQGNLPLATIDELLQAQLVAAEGDEYLGRLSARIERNRKTGAPKAPGVLEHAPDPSWPTASALAREQLDALDHAGPGFAYRFALARAVAVFRRRPDALRVALERASGALTPGVRDAVPVLRATMDELDDGRLAWLRRQVATEGWVADEAADPSAAVTDGKRRRSSALIAREAGDAAR